VLQISAQGHDKNEHDVSKIWANFIEKSLAEISANGSSALVVQQ